MSSKVNKIYNKAMDYYENGDINKAIKKCEEGISLDLKNSNILNLKGLLLYLKGELEEAVTVWKINYDYNEDDISRIYIKEARNDEGKMELYKLAEVDIRELRINDALQKLEQCAISDFNSLNVSSALAVCYFRKADYKKAKSFANKALKLNKNDKTALAIKKELVNINTNPKDTYKSNVKKICIIGGIIVFIIGGVIINKIHNGNTNSDTETAISSEVEDSAEESQVEDTSNEESVTEENVADESEDEAETTMVLTADEIKEYYINGTDYYEEGSYAKAIEVLSLAYNTETESYLKEHILYLLASSYNQEGDTDSAAKYYEIYAEDYSTGSYIEEIYYNLALYYLNEDSSKSKEYANMLITNYPDSIYNNSNIESILES